MIEVLIDASKAPSVMLDSPTPLVAGPWRARL
jgi:hypothetical protein